MVELNNWETQFGAISNSWVLTTQECFETQYIKCKKSQSKPHSLYALVAQQPVLPTLAPARKNIELTSWKLALTSGTSPNVCKTVPLPTTWNSDSHGWCMANFATAIWAVFCILFGVMTNPGRAASTQKFVHTITRLELSLDQSKDSSNSSCTIGVLKHPLGSERTMSFVSELWMSVVLVAFGISKPPWLTMMSMMTSGRTSLASWRPHSVTNDGENRETWPNADTSLDVAATEEPSVTGSQPPTEKREKEQEKKVEVEEEEDKKPAVLSPEEEEDEWEIVDETIVHANCIGAIETDLMKPGKPVLFVDMDTETPLIQIGPAIFHGTYQDCLGTDLLFEKGPRGNENPSELPKSDANPSSSADLPTNPSKSHGLEIFASRAKRSGRHQFSYFGKTSKNLVLQRVFLKPKQNS